MSLNLDDQTKREKIIQESFETIAKNYDLLNNLLSFGLQGYWKFRFVCGIHPQKSEKILDLAGGTGSIAKRMMSSGAEIFILDPSEAMLQVAKERYGDRFEYYQNEGEFMPFEDETFDTVCISFGIRNAKSIEAMNREIFRVLKKGGKFYCLEFSKPHRFFMPFYGLYLKWILPTAGKLISGDRRAYQYLGESILRFLSQKELAMEISQAGFRNVEYQNLTFGAVAIHSGKK